MPPVIGIPRALLYYEYFPLWYTFFETLGLRVTISPETNKRILENGLKNCVDEACLPIKVAMGHVMDLIEKADYIFLPRMVSLVPREYICPKFLGFPDMVRSSLSVGSKLIDSNIDLYRPKTKAEEPFLEMGRLFGQSVSETKKNFKNSHAVWAKYRKLLQSNFLPTEAMQALREKSQVPRTHSPGALIAVVGHSYNIYDNHISMNIIRRLRQSGLNVATPENVPEVVLRSEAARLPKRLFWTLGQQLVGSAFHFMRNRDIAGIILVTSFGCGPDALTGELIERYLKRIRPLPFLRLTLDEHTGDAGVITRMEAFLDMIRRKEAL